MKADAPKAKAIEKASYGKVDGKPVDLYTLTNARALIAKITNYGAIVTELHVPDKARQAGRRRAGFDNVDDYVKKSPYFGAIVGRVANRIKDATFKLDGKTYKLNANDAPHHLHGGKKGWDKVIWTAEPKETKDGPSLKLTYVSQDGDENYPGTVTATDDLHADQRQRAQGRHAGDHATRRRSSTWRTTATGTWPAAARSSTTS